MGTRSVIAKPDGDGWAGRYVHWDGYPSGVGRQLWHGYHGHFGQDVDAMIDLLIERELVGWSQIAGVDWSLPPSWDDPHDPNTPCVHPGCGEPMWRHYAQYYPEGTADDPMVSGKHRAGLLRPDQIAQFDHSHEADLDKPKGPQSYTARGEKVDTDLGTLIRNTDPDSGTEWAYVLAKHALIVCERRFGKVGEDQGHGVGMFGMGASDTEAGGHWAVVAECRWDAGEPDWNTLDSGVDGDDD